MWPTPSASAYSSLGAGLVVAVHVDALGGDAAGERHVELAARGDVDREPLLGHQPVDGGQRQRLAREQDLEVVGALAEGAQELAGAGADVVLGVYVGRGAERASELDHVTATDLEVAGLVDAAPERVDGRPGDRVGHGVLSCAHGRPLCLSGARHPHGDARGLLAVALGVALALAGGGLRGAGAVAVPLALARGSSTAGVVVVAGAGLVAVLLVLGFSLPWPRPRDFDFVLLLVEGDAAAGTGCATASGGVAAGGVPVSAPRLPSRPLPSPLPSPPLTLGAGATVTAGVAGIAGSASAVSPRPGGFMRAYFSRVCCCFQSLHRQQGELD